MKLRVFIYLIDLNADVVFMSFDVKAVDVVAIDNISSVVIGSAAINYGIAKLKEEGKYRGRRINERLHQDIREQLTLGRSYLQIQQKLGCRWATIAWMVKQQV